MTVLWLLWDEFGPKTPRGEFPRRVVDGSSIAAPTSRVALLGALPSRTVQSPRTGRSAQNVKEAQR